MTWDYKAHLAESIEAVSEWLDDDSGDVPHIEIQIVTDWARENQ